MGSGLTPSSRRKEWGQYTLLLMLTAASSASATTAEVVGSEPGAGTLEQHARHQVALDLDGVEHAVDVGEQLVVGHEGRMHAQLHALVAAAGDGEQLDGVAEFCGVREVARRRAP